MKHLLAILALLISLQSFAQKKITFLSKDGLIITADLYLVNDTLPYMILCHQAGYSRGEYLETGKKFTKLGYNCIALDQRSGKEVNGVSNETASLAEAKKKGVGYLDAEQDMISAVDYAYKKSNKKVILVGSSYSASLALKIAAGSEKVKALILFSPGEYFGTQLKIKDAIKDLDKPLWVTSTKDEAPDVESMLKDIKSKVKVQYVPPTKGDHGSKVLWKENGNYHEYWLHILMFMRQVG
jgi:pimeloyl-ACP methyl ester carboxylesterase